MSYKQMTGNIISATKVEPDGKFVSSAASGVWNLQDQYDYVRGDNWPNAGNPANTAVFFGGAGGSGINNSIQTVVITSLGNATDIGNLTYSPAQGCAACSSSTRAIVSGGQALSDNTINYWEYASGGNGSDFGNLLSGAGFGYHCGLSSSTRGIFAGGQASNESISNVIEYVTLANTGNGTDFGDLTVARNELRGCASPTRGIIGGGKNSSNSPTNILDYITIASVGNATDFGNLSRVQQLLASASSATRGLWAGGTGGDEDHIDYVTIASTGNATNFGDLSVARHSVAGSSNLTRAIFGGGYASSSGQNIIDYVTIASTGNAQDFGDLAIAQYNGAASSNSHGGITA